MEGSRWLTILLIGLMLSGAVVGYFLIRNTFMQNGQAQPQVAQTPQATPSTPQSTPEDFILGQQTPPTTPPPQPSPRPTAKPASSFAQISPTPASAISQLTNRAQAGVQKTQTLPNTGVPLFLSGTLSILAIIIGFRLRKYPNL